MNDRVALSVIGLASALVVVIVAVLLLGRQPKTGAVHGVSALPAVNAALNGTSAALLTAGYCFIRQRKVTAHKTCMLTAFGIISHLSLAVVVIPLALMTIYRAWRQQFARHMRLARWTLPVWLYVSVTGVVVYWMLYHLTPQP